MIISGVLMVAWYHNSEPTAKGPQVNNINWWYKPYFYKHALEFVKEKREYEVCKETSDLRVREFLRLNI